MRKMLLAAVAALAVAGPTLADPAEDTVASWVWVRGKVVEANTLYSNSMMTYLTHTGFHPIEEMSTPQLNDVLRMTDALLTMARSTGEICDLVRVDFGPELLKDTRCDALDDDVEFLRQDRVKADAQLVINEAALDDLLRQVTNPEEEQ